MVIHNLKFTNVTWNKNNITQSLLEIPRVIKTLVDHTGLPTYFHVIMALCAAGHEECDCRVFGPQLSNNYCWLSGNQAFELWPEMDDEALCLYKNNGVSHTVSCLVITTHFSSTRTSSFLSNNLWLENNNQRHSMHMCKCKSHRFFLQMLKQNIQSKFTCRLEV